MRLSRADTFLIILAAAFLLPAVIPRVGLDFQYFFIMVIVLFAWFIIKWDSVRNIESKARLPEVLAGSALIGLDYGYNAFKVSNVGVIDLIIIFVGAVVLNYGFRSLKQFWVPIAYGLVLLAGYDIEGITPNYVVLQNWLAGVMASMVKGLGIGATASGDLVYMNLSNGTPVALEVAGACTGLQGILAFGMLSTMALLDLKPKLSRIVPIFVIGFVGAFLINIVRLLAVFLTFEFFGVEAGNTMHVYFGYLIFVAWVMVFWAVAFKYLVPRQTILGPAVSLPPANPILQ
jgi:exosortase/archaeosortase family protein